jgi:hypothetical protein
MSGLFANYKATSMGGGVHGQLSLVTAVIHVGLVNEGTDYTTADAYVTELANDQDWDDVGLYTIAACYGGEPTQALGAKTTDDGVFDNTADITFPTVDIDGAKNVDVLIHFNSGGTITTDQLICLHDGFTPVTPNSGDIVVAYHASGIFAF